jgi:hypothetical protein
MGASISFDSKYRLILDTEVECISVNPPNTKSSASAPTSTDDRRKNKKGGRVSDSDSESDHGSESDSSNASESDSERENKTYTVKLTPEIISYIRSYLRKNEFLDEFDLITEIDLDNYDHAPGSALVFNSDSIVFNTNNQTIESVGEWEYLPPEHEEKQAHSSSKSKSKTKSKNKNRRGHDDSESNSDSDDDNSSNERRASKYKTKDDDLPVSEIENILKVKFEEYNKGREFIIHESKNSFLCLNINSVEIVKA